MQLISLSNQSNRINITGIVDPVKGKQQSGIACYGKFIGWILSLFGWAIKLEDKNVIFYVNRRSAIKWLLRHDVNVTDKTSSKNIISEIYQLATTVGIVKKTQLPFQGNNAEFKRHLNMQLMYLREKMDEAIAKHQHKKSMAADFGNRKDLPKMEALFNASEALLDCDHPLPIEEHPLFKQLNEVGEEGVVTTTIASGPTIQDMTDIILGRSTIDSSKILHKEGLKLDIFNNAETFMRCLDIFKSKYEEKTGKTIDCEVTFSLPHTPVDHFCDRYVQYYPEIAGISKKEREKLIRLLAVFNIHDEIVELDMTFKIKIISKENFPKRSFRPIIDLKALEKTIVSGGSNDISQGQKNLEKQIQNLSGSELSMPYIKEVDCEAQFQALQAGMKSKTMKMVDIGGGRGENNGLLKAIQEKGISLSLLNVEPYAPFAEPYIAAGKAVGVQEVTVLQKCSQDLTATDVVKHFNGEKADAIFASHSFYFSLGDMHKTTLAYVKEKSQLPLLSQHPMAKYFEMIKENGVIVVTLQSGAGARLFRNVLLGNHGLNPPEEEPADETVSLLSSFGNLATYLRHLDIFIQRYQKETGKKIQIKTRHAVANVPLGKFKIGKDANTGGYIIHNPDGIDTDSSWIAPKMLDFYGNWKELQALATMTNEKANTMSKEELKKLGLENCSHEQLIEKRQAAIKSQEVYLQILRAFAPGMKNMQHPNVTLEITVRN